MAMSLPHKGYRDINIKSKHKETVNHLMIKR